MNRKDKLKRKKRRQLKGRSAAHRQIVDFGFGAMVQDGRVVSQVTFGDTAEANAARAAFLGQKPQIEQGLSELQTELVGLLQTYDALNILGQVMFVYANFDGVPLEGAWRLRNPAHVEYLALQILSLGPDLPPKVTDISDENNAIERVLELVPELFRLKMRLMTLETVVAQTEGDKIDDEKFRSKARLESLVVRGASYKDHHHRVLHGCFDAFEDELRAACGFTVVDALNLYEGMASLAVSRFADRALAAREGTQLLLERIRAGSKDPEQRQGLPDWAYTQSREQQREAAMNLSALYMFHEFRELVLITPEQLAEHVGSTVETCAGFMEAFAADPTSYRAEFHGSPVGVHPLTQTPILRVAGAYILPTAAVFLDAIRPVMEDVLRKKAPRAWSRYLSNRADFVAREAARALGDSLPGSLVWDSAIKWKGVNDDSDLDGLVRVDDAGIRIQCKGGRLSDSARRGSIERMRTNVRDLIHDAVEQHAALSNALESQKPSELGFDKSQEEALLCPIQVEIVVCLDDLTVWATEAHELGTVGLLPEGYPVPLVLSLTDLMAVTEILSGTQLIHYLIRRLRLERDGRVSAHDELDWLGHYLKEGLYFDRYFEPNEDGDRLDGFRLGTYTDDIDAWYLTREMGENVKPKPARKLPSTLQAFVHRLEKELPPHWLSAGLAMIDGDEKSQRHWKTSIKHAQQRCKTVGWSNVSQVFNDRFGITYYSDTRMEGDEIIDALEDFCEKKRADTGERLWITVGSGRDKALHVAVDAASPDALQSALMMFVPGSTAQASHHEAN